MAGWFKNLKLRYKLLFTFFFILTLPVLVGIVALTGQFYIQTTVNKLLHVDDQVATLASQAQEEFLKAFSRGKDFFLNYRKDGLERAKVEHVNRVHYHINAIHNIMSKIRELSVHKQDVTVAEAIDQAIDKYEQTFLTLVALIEKQGVKDSGLEGLFREKAHMIEKLLDSQGSNQLIVHVLNIRRQEKDYLLRKEGKYIALLDEEIDILKGAITKLDSAVLTQRDSVLTALDQYQEAFKMLVKVDAEIAANMDAYDAHDLESLLQQIHDTSAANKQQAQADIQQVATTIILLVIGVGVFAVGIGLLIAFVLAGALAKPLTLIVQGAQALTVGDMKLNSIDKIQLANMTTRQDEMGEIGQAFVALASYFQEVVADIVRVSQGLAEGNLKVMPQVDYRGDFASIRNSLQTSLPEQQRVIEDIIQVSQGLAEGNLQIKAQGKYRGDFLQIKEALETALTSLRYVIGDIVKVSQGLADGDSQIVPQAEYRGDFVQIKRALTTAVVKLAEATAQNTAQNWLKNGQAQLSSQMSGEQDLNTLAKNVISFLTTYLDMQVGLFYLIKNTQQNNSQSLLQVVASYAYTSRRELPTQFSLGEGLVGEAALSQKVITRSYSPQEYTYIAQSGLTQTVPCHVLIAPFLYEGAVKGVIELGSAYTFTEKQQTFLEQVIPAIGIAINTAESRTKMQILLQKSQKQAEELQVQQEELQQTNEELHSQQEEMQHRNEELQSQSEELQAQAEELQTQQEELRQANEELEKRTRDLEWQREEIQNKNRLLEKTQMEMEKTQVAVEIKAQELEQASRYKSEFLANMSHELRTPLNSLLILAQLLSENKGGNLTDKQIEYVRTIHNAGSELLSLINEILDLSKVEAGHMEVHAEELVVAEFVKMIEQRFRPIAEEKKLAFHIQVTEKIPLRIQTDLQRLKQVITNLLANAFKFTAAGEVKLIINTENVACTNYAGNYLAFAIIDTGIGIPKDKQTLIFEAFQQVDGTTSRRYGGTGLGLSISQQLAKLLGGQIYLTSEEGKGSTFILCLPLNGEATNPKIQTSENSNSQNFNNPSQQLPKKSNNPENSFLESIIIDDRTFLQATDKFILIIEDDSKFRQILVDLAHEKTFKCLLAADGRMGLQLAEEYNPHAIILDIGLPDIDGWTVMGRLKENSETRHIPVHFISATERSAEARQMGAIGYLAKPVNMAQLTDVFKKITQFIAKTLRNVLIISDNEQRTHSILTVVEGDGVKATVATSQLVAQQQLNSVMFDCIILDLEVEQSSGIEMLEFLHAEDKLTPIPLIIYAEQDLTPQQEAVIQRCADSLTVKAVQSPARLLDEVTLFLHQVAKQLPQEKQRMLHFVHDKETVLTHKKVLIVDDDVRNTFALMTFLEDKRMDVLVGYNGKEALKLLEGHPDVDIVLMDIMMPEMDGYEATRQIRAKPQFRKLPVIALTAKAMKGDRAKCIEAGANDYITKPVDTNKLSSLLRVWLYR